MSSTSSSSCTIDASAGNLSTSTFSNLSFTNKDVVYDKCPRCGALFDFLKRVNASKVPLVLNCKHVVCEDCIKKMCLSNVTVCPVCRNRFTVPRSQLDNLTDVFPPHFTLIGQLVWSKNSNYKKNMSFVSTGYTLKQKNSDFSFDTDDDGSDISPELIFTKCPEHGDQYLNIFCEECDNTYCCYCFLENHPGHRATYLYKLKDEEMQDLERLKTDIEVVLAQLFASNKRIKELKTSESTNYFDVEIKSYFNDLHAKLHLAERNIRKKFLNVETKETDLDGVLATLKLEICRANRILNYLNRQNDKQINLRVLYEEAKQIRNAPCKLVSKEGGLNSMEFLTDNIFDEIEERIVGNVVPSVEYGLIPIEDWNVAQEKYELVEIKRCSSDVKIDEEQKVEVAKALKSADNKKRRSSEGSKIRVVLTHINDLSSFFIQKVSSLDVLSEMNANIGKKISKKNNVDDWKLGGTYGVSYSTKSTSRWRRGKLIDVIYKDDECQFKVFFIDYGNTQIVSKNRLKHIDPRTIQRQPFAYECRLTNPNNISFEPNAYLHLMRIVGDKDLYLSFVDKKSNNGISEVDLFILASDGSFNPIRDLLSSKKSIIEEPDVENFAIKSELKLFENSKEFTIGQEYHVMVTYIKDPFNICFQISHNLNFIEKLKEKMEQYYNKKKGNACIPVINTNVAAKYPYEGQGVWHRASVTSVNYNTQEVDVFFVDWGYNTTVPWSDIRLLTNEFIKMECQCIIAKLAHVENLDLSQDWSKEAISFLREEILPTETCTIVVSNLDPLEVALFKTRPAANVCINTLLVEKGYALSTGALSQTILWPNNAINNGPEEDDDFAYQMVRKSEEIIMAEEEDFHLRKGLKMQVSILNFKSPDLIYAKFQKYKDLDDEMHKELQIHYSKSKNKTRKIWKVGEICVVFDQVRNNYFRGVIKAVFGDNYLVYLYDHARELKVPKTAIFVQNHYFSKFMCYVCKCRLSGIRPAGDAGKWSSLAVEMLEKIFTNYKTIYIKKIEMNKKEKMLGVIMWYCLTTQAKALEPSKIKYISVTQCLIESGVAFINNSPCLSSDEVLTKEEKKSNWFEMCIKDEEKDEDEEDPSNEQFYVADEQSWPKPYKIQKREFNAVLTCVDDMGVFSIRDEQMHAYYLELEENITRKFNSMDVASDDVEWHTNDMCTIFYEGKWYRGTVLNVLSNEEISVEMIDFGSEHIVSFSEISKLIMFPDIPPFINKVKLYDVYFENEDWSSFDINDLLQIVTDNVRVVIKSDLNDDIPSAEFYLENGLSINDLISQKCPNVKRLENKVVLGGVDYIDKDTSSENEACMSESRKYNYVSLTTEKKLFVIDVLDWHNCYSVVLSTEKNVISSIEYQNLSRTIQKYAKKQPALVNIDVDQPCVCVHTATKLWARAVVHKTDSLKYGFVLMFFVDYGSVEMVPVGGLKEIRSDWLDFPVSLQLACIDIELLQNNQREYVLRQMRNWKGKSVIVKIISKEPLKVHLDDGENLIYQEFANCGIIKIL